MEAITFTIKDDEEIYLELKFLAIKLKTPIEKVIEKLVHKEYEKIISKMKTDEIGIVYNKIK